MKCFTSLAVLLVWGAATQTATAQASHDDKSCRTPEEMNLSMVPPSSAGGVRGFDPTAGYEASMGFEPLLEYDAVAGYDQLLGFDALLGYDRCAEFQAEAGMAGMAPQEEVDVRDLLIDAAGMRAIMAGQPDPETARLDKRLRETREVLYGMDGMDNGNDAQLRAWLEAEQEAAAAIAAIKNSTSRSADANMLARLRTASRHAEAALEECGARRLNGEIAMDDEASARLRGLRNDLRTIERRVAEIVTTRES